MTDKVELIHRRIEEIKANTKDKQFASPYYTGRVDLCNELLSLIDSMQEEPVIQNVIAELVGVSTGAVELANVPDRKDPQYIQELKDKLNSMSKEEFDKEWDKCKPDEEEPSISAVFDEHWWESLGKGHVSEDLEKFALQYAEHHAPYNSCMQEVEDAVKAGVKWQKEQMIKNTTEVTVHIDAGNYPYIPQIELYDYDKDVPLAKEGDEYKVVLIKKD